jgi:hypothetical protein
VKPSPKTSRQKTDGCAMGPPTFSDGCAMGPPKSFWWVCVGGRTAMVGRWSGKKNVFCQLYTTIHYTPTIHP